MNIRYNPKGRPPSSLRVVITHNGKAYHKAIGVTVQKWDNTRQKCGDTDKDNLLLNLKVKLIEELGYDPSETAILGSFRHIDRGRWKDIPQSTDMGQKTPRFADFLKAWAQRPSGAQRQNKTAVKVILECVGENTEWEDIGDAFYARLIRKFDARGMRPNYQGVVIGRLKTALKEAHSLGYLADFRLGDWHKPSEPTFAVALNSEEVEMVWSADLPPKLAKARDLFIVGIYTAGRYSDYSRLTTDDLQGDRVAFVQKKTDTPVLLPCHPRIRMVLERNGGRLPYMEIQTFNKRVKEVCRLAGIDTLVQAPQGTLERLGKEKGARVFKWELCSSHTARRTGASLLYKSGVPVRVCRYLTGHTKDDTFLKYIRIDREEAADILAASPFFG